MSFMKGAEVLRIGYIEPLLAQVYKVHVNLTCDARANTLWSHDASRTHTLGPLKTLESRVRVSLEARRIVNVFFSVLSGIHVCDFVIYGVHICVFMFSGVGICVFVLSWIGIGVLCCLKFLFIILCLSGSCSCFSIVWDSYSCFSVFVWDKCPCFVCLGFDCCTFMYRPILRW